MSGVKFFLDSNIILYQFDRHDAVKKSTATALVKQAVVSREGCISYQVVQEVLNVASRKETHIAAIVDLPRLLDELLEPLCHVYSTIALYHQAVEVRARWRFSFYDSLIVAAALQAGCKTLYSEDLQHRQQIESLTIVNPFSESEC